MNDDHIYIYGTHAVREALRARPESVTKVFLEEGTHAGIASEAREQNIEQATLSSKKLPGGVSKTATHQGCVAELNRESLLTPYKTFINALSVTTDTALLVLGEIQDPHNVGAAIRSAAAFGLSGVLIPPHNQAPINGTVVKVSAGGAFSVPLIEIRNVNATLRDLKGRGFWVYGLEGEGSTALNDETFSKPSVFVLGNEATGLRKMTAEVCDELLRISISSQMESLNAAASTAVVLSAWSAQHKDVLR